MTLSKREQGYAIAVGAVVAGLGLWTLVISPYFDAMADLDSQTQKQIATQEDNTRLFARRDQLKKVWTDMQNNGLKLDPATAQSQAYHAVLDWAQQANVQLDGTKLERPSDAGDFEIIRFSVSGPSSSRSISRLLWDLETSPIPLRVNQLSLHALKPGSDNLTMQLDISTLCLMPTDQSSPDDASENMGGMQ